MRISEIFLSIQGESTTAGFPCVFVRFFGCNLRCGWCDTKYAVQYWVKNPKKGKDFKLMDVGQVLDAVECLNVKYVCLTGGEPLIQDGINELIRKLIGKKYQVEIRTNGTIDTLSLKELNPEIRIVLDVKCPGSGMEQIKKQILIRNFEKLNSSDEAVFVLRDRKDYQFAKGFIKQHKTKAVVNLSSVFDQLSYSKLAKWILEDRLEIRLNVQTQKFVWGVNERGV